jgi:hypothetical protein
MGHRTILASRACLALRLAPNPPGLPRSHRITWQHAAGSGPRRCQRHLAMNDVADAAFPIERQGRPPHNTIDFGANPFHLRCSLLPPCLRFVIVVPTPLRMGGPRRRSAYHAKLGSRLLARHYRGSHCRSPDSVRLAAHPPQIRACATSALGSSDHRFATQLYMEW